MKNSTAKADFTSKVSASNLNKPEGDVKVADFTAKAMEVLTTHAIQLMEGLTPEQEADATALKALTEAHLASVRREKEQLERALNALYTETEKLLPPKTPSQSEQTWNDAFYTGQLKALELVCQRVFGKSGDELIGEQS